MKKDPLAVGTPLGHRTYEVSAERVGKYATGIGAHANPWYHTASTYGAPVAPAAILYYEPARFDAFMDYLAQRPGWNTRCDWAFIRPVPVGETLTLSLSITDRWIKRGREHARFTMDAVNRKGELVCQGSYYEAYDDTPIEYEPPLPVREGSSSELNVPAGAIVASFEQTFTLPMSVAMNRPEPNFHTVKALAQKRGFPDCVLAGAQIVCQLAELMTQALGQVVLEGGTLKLNFLKPVIVDETITAHLATGPAQAASAEEDAWTIWAENARGEKVIAGIATTPRRASARPPILPGVWRTDLAEYHHA